MNFDEKIFPKNFLKEEMRSGFWVDEKRKKVWAVELQILKKFDEVCKKYHLTYYAHYGTLLGAARHQGFIPWDDDIDVAMFRDDYEKFQSIAQSEFTEPYFFQGYNVDAVLCAHAKIRDSRTAAIEYPHMPHLNQGIFIDVFPLDDVPDGIHGQLPAFLDIQRELWTIIVNPGMILSGMEAGKKFILNKETIMSLVKMDTRQKMKLFSDFSLSHFGVSENVNFISCEMYSNQYKSVKRAWFQNITYLPFEDILLPAPAEYDKILTQSYGNWHEYVQGASEHENIIFDPDMSYQEYFEKYGDSL